MLTSGGVPFPTTPPPVPLSQVMYDGATGQYEKTITITNNNPTQYLYAFLEGEDSRQAICSLRGDGRVRSLRPIPTRSTGATSATPTARPITRACRPLSSITITVPLAFWDSGRIIFSTDGADQFRRTAGTPVAPPAGAPFYYQHANTAGDASSATSTPAISAS